MFAHAACHAPQSYAERLVLPGTQCCLCDDLMASFSQAEPLSDTLHAAFLEKRV